MFRAERPQAGRLRQFNQIGVEAIGSSSPVLDAEIVMLMAAILDSAGIKDYELKLNNLGCRDDKKRLSAALRKIFSGTEGKLLCGDCKKRVKTNPLRILDCKEENCRVVVRKVFKGADFLCRGCRIHFDSVKKILDLAGTRYTVDPFIVRGLDYYTKTVFEVTSAALGSQDAIGAGGRYDNLTSDMGGPEVGACGFALGLERMALILDKLLPQKDGRLAIDVFVAAMGDAGYEKAFLLAGELRNSGVSCDMDYENKSLKAQMRRADLLGARFVVMIGEDELKAGAATLRDMRTKEQTSVRFDEVLRAIKCL
jgi:histidyl-tRNA synthetase